MNRLNKISILHKYASGFYKIAGHKSRLIKRYPKYKNEISHAAEEGVKPAYLSWVVTQLQLEEPYIEIIALIKEFERFRPRLKEKDLFKYQTLGDLRGAIEAGGLSREQRAEKRREALSSDHELVYKDEKITVVHPQTKEASQHFGKGTRWCISAQVSQNMFENYSNRNIFFYFIISKGADLGNMSKIAYSIAKTRRDGSMRRGAAQIFDASDGLIKEKKVKHFLGDKYEKIMDAINQNLEGKEYTKIVEVYKKITPEEVDANFAAADPIKRFDLKRKLIINRHVTEKIKEYVKNKFKKITIEEVRSQLESYDDDKQRNTLRGLFLRDKYISKNIKRYINQSILEITNTAEKADAMAKSYTPITIDDFNNSIEFFSNPNASSHISLQVLRDYIYRISISNLLDNETLLYIIKEFFNKRLFKEELEHLLIHVASETKLTYEQADALHLKAWAIGGYYYIQFLSTFISSKNVSIKFRTEKLGGLDIKTKDKVFPGSSYGLGHELESILYNKTFFPKVKDLVIERLRSDSNLHFYTARSLLTKLKDPDVDKAVLDKITNTNNINIWSIFALNNISNKRPDLKEFIDEEVARQIESASERAIIRAIQSGKMKALTEDNQKKLANRLLKLTEDLTVSLGNQDGYRWGLGSDKIQELRIQIKSIRKVKNIIKDEEFARLDKMLLDVMQKELFNSKEDPIMKRRRQEGLTYYRHEYRMDAEEEYGEKKYSFLRYLLITDLKNYFPNSANLAKKILRRDFPDKIRSDKSLNIRREFRRYSLGIEDIYGDNSAYAELGLYEKDGVDAVDSMEEYLIENISIDPKDFVAGFMTWSVENFLENPEEHYDKFDFIYKSSSKDFGLGYRFHQEIESNFQRADFVGADIEQYPEMTHEEFEVMTFGETKEDSEEDLQKWYESELGYAEEEFDEEIEDDEEPEEEVVEEDEEEGEDPDEADEKLEALANYLFDSGLYKEAQEIYAITKTAVLKKLKRTTRGKGKKDRMEWALVSKSNPKKILKWFGPEKPSKKQIAKEERRIHAFK